MNKHNEKFIKKNGIDLSKIDTRIYKLGSTKIWNNWKNI